jgi:gallate dioxygenase
MAKIIGAIATSHSPTIGFALDKQKQDEPAWAPICEATGRFAGGWNKRSPTSCF